MTYRDLAALLQGSATEAEPDFATVLTSAEGRLLTKRHTPEGTLDFTAGRLFTSRRVAIASLDDLAAALDLAPNECLILGRHRGDGSQPHPRRKLGDDALYDEATHRFLIVDIDGPPEDGLDWLDDINGTIARVVRQSWLPPELAGVDAAWRLTSSAGIKPGIRLRLAFMLDRAIGCDEAKAWLADYPNADQAIYSAVQPIYGAAPIFDGVPDPIGSLPRAGRYAGRQRTASPPGDLSERLAAKRTSGAQSGWQTGSPIELEMVADMLTAIGAPGEYVLVRDIAAAVAAANVIEDPDMSLRADLFCDWAGSGSVPDHDGQDFRRVFYSMAQPGPIGVGTLFHHAREAGWCEPQPDRGDASEVFAGFFAIYQAERQAERKSRRRGKMWTIAEGAALPPNAYLDANNLIPERGIVIAYGPQGSHKTGWALATGIECAQAGHRVLYIAGEDARGVSTARLPALLRHLGIGLDALEDRWLTSETMFSLAQGLPADIGEEVADFAPKIIVFDVLSYFLEGDWNTPNVGGDFMKAARRLVAQTDASILFLAHPGKEEARGIIGSSQFKSLADAVLRIEATDSQVIAHVEKMKNGEAHDRIIAYRRIAGLGGVPIVGAVEAGGKRRERSPTDDDAIVIHLAMAGAMDFARGIEDRALAEMICGPARDGEDGAAHATRIAKMAVALRQRRSRKSTRYGSLETQAGGTQLFWRWHLGANA